MNDSRTPIGIERRLGSAWVVRQPKMGMAVLSVMSRRPRAYREAAIDLDPDELDHLAKLLTEEAARLRVIAETA